jgi:hypothetical protein
MNRSWWAFLAVQLAVVVALVGSHVYARQRQAPLLSPTIREKAWLPTPLYDRPELVNDEQLLTTLLRLRPKFDTGKLRVNFVEHALRVWGADAQFDDSACMSGAEMVRFLTDHARFIDVYGDDTPGLITDTSEKLDIRWVGRGGDFPDAASRHHDHWLACLVEGGVRLDHIVHTPRRQLPLRRLLDTAISDFHVDEREYEWSAMVFAYYVDSTNGWRSDEPRRVTFDLVARRLLRADDILGVCTGTHRLYALATLLRRHAESPILSPDIHQQVSTRLRTISDTLVKSQEPTGLWNRRWPEGAAAVDGKDTSSLTDKVLVTGHHLEWLSIAPKELLPPEQHLILAGQGLVKAVADSSDATIAGQYTFYSHVVGALSNWRSKRAVQVVVPATPARL